MGDSYTDVNKYAHEGGDTAPGTREEIAERNAAADKVAEASVARAEAMRDASDKASEDVMAAEEAYRKAVPVPEVVGAKDSADALAAKQQQAAPAEAPKKSGK